MKTVYIILAEGFEESEALIPADLLRRADCPVRLVALDNGATVKGSHGIVVGADLGWDELRLEQAELILLPGGGAGTDNLEQHSGLALLLRQGAEQGIPLAAICAAPRVLGRLGLLKGRRACCYPGNEEALTGAIVCQSPTVRDGNIITGRGMGASFEFGLAVVEFLCGSQRAQQLSERILWQAQGIL